MLQHNTHVLCNCITMLNTMGENEIETRAEFKPNLNASHMLLPLSYIGALALEMVIDTVQTWMSM